MWTLKNIIQYYTSKGSVVYLCFLDASKAVNYWKLFNKLLVRGTPGYIVNLLMYWYTSQEITVKWGNSFSLSFKTANGIRQRGISWVSAAAASRNHHRVLNQIEEYL